MYLVHIYIMSFYIQMLIVVKGATSNYFLFSANSFIIFTDLDQNCFSFSVRYSLFMRGPILNARKDYTKSQIPHQELRGPVHIDCCCCCSINILEFSSLSLLLLLLYYREVIASHIFFFFLSIVWLKFASPFMCFCCSITG